MFLLQPLWLEKGYERRGRRQMFDTPSNLTTGNAKPQHGAAAGRRVTRLGKGTARERSRSIIRLSATRWSKGGHGFRVDREVMMHLGTQFGMRVQAPPSRGRSDSLSPRSATGSQRSEAGSNGGPWQPHAGYPVSQASMDSASAGVVAPPCAEPSARG